MSHSQYTVIPKGNNRLGIVDLKTNIMGRSVQYSGNLITPPMVSGDECTFMVENDCGTRRMMFMKLPHGMIYQSKEIC